MSTTKAHRGDSAPSWFKFYPIDWMNDERVIRLSYESQGVLIQIISWAWSRQSDSIPDDEKTICRRLGLHPNKWRVLRTELTHGDAPLLSTNTPGVLTYTPHGPALVSAGSRRYVASNAGSISASNRAKLKAADTTDRSTDSPTDIDKIQSRTDKNPPTPRKPVEQFEVPSWVPAEPWADFCELRVSRNKKTWTLGAKKRTIADLAKLRDQGHDPAKVLNQSVQRGWMGVFALKRDQAEPEASDVSWAELDAAEEAAKAASRGR